MATDRAGRDLLAGLLAAADDIFSTDPNTLSSATEGDLRDHIDLSIANPDLSEELAIVLRLRNSLLNTALLYNVMLAAQGAKAIDWLGSDLQRIGPALEMGTWYSGHMGMRLAVQNGDGFVDVARIPDAGPIAWKDVGIVLPVPPEPVVRVRLSFVADSWRIDRVTTTTKIRRPQSREILPTTVVSAHGFGDDALDALGKPDQHYLKTLPGQSLRLSFDVGTDTDVASETQSNRTFLMAAQGHYTEWVRGDWIRTASTDGFGPTDASLVTALTRWQQQRHDLRARLEATRIPVR